MEHPIDAPSLDWGGFAERNRIEIPEHMLTLFRTHNTANKSSKDTFGGYTKSRPTDLGLGIVKQFVNGRTHT